MSVLLYVYGVVLNADDMNVVPPEISALGDVGENVAKTDGMFFISRVFLFENEFLTDLSCSSKIQ